jgi:hypothetical protein
VGVAYRESKSLLTERSADSKQKEGKDMKKLIGVVFFMLVAGLVFAQSASTYYHIEIYSRTSNYFGDIPHFAVDDSRLDKNQAYYEFYHRNTGYAFFIYATKGEASAITAPDRSPVTNAAVYKLFDWSGTSYNLFETQLNKIVLQSLLTNKAEVEKLKVVLKYKLYVPR